MRDDFTQSIRRSLAHRVNLLCSNPECRANTSGSQTDPDKAVNVGVAAHISAASQGGPRFNKILSEKVRRSASNGIWLCQTCAKLVDSDEQKYTTLLLLTWKQSAEKEAESRIGKTNRHNNQQTSSKAEKELKRNHQIRDELTRAFQLSVEQRRALPVNAPQYRKYSEGEFIVHRLGESCYPGSDNSSGISAWFKLEMFDFLFQRHRRHSKYPIRASDRAH